MRHETYEFYWELLLNVLRIIIKVHCQLLLKLLYILLLLNLVT